MDIFFEQIIAKKTTMGDIIKKILLVVAVVLVAVLVVNFSFMEGTIGEFVSSVGFLLVVAAGYGAYLLMTSLNIEYEYILTNGEIDIDKIVARRKRKRLITASCRKFTEFGEYSTDKTFGDATVIMACISPDQPNTYYGVVETVKYGKCAVVFNPNEKILANIKTYVRRNVSL